MRTPLGQNKIDDMLGNPAPGGGAPNDDLGGLLEQPDTGSAAPSTNTELMHLADQAERSAGVYQGHSEKGADPASLAHERYRADADLGELILEANRAGWHGLARRAAEMWHRRDHPRRREFSNMVNSYAPEAVSHPEGALPDEWTEHLTQQSNFDILRWALNYTNTPVGGGPEDTIPRAHPNDDGDEVTRKTYEGNVPEVMDQLRNEYFERNADPGNPNVRHDSIDIYADEATEQAYEEWETEYQGMKGDIDDGGSSSSDYAPDIDDDDDEDDDDEDEDASLPEFKDVAIKDPKPRSAGSPREMGIDEREVKGALPDGVSLGQSGYGRRYGRR